MTGIGYSAPTLTPADARHRRPELAVRPADERGLTMPRGFLRLRRDRMSRPRFKPEVTTEIPPAHLLSSRLLLTWK